MTGRCSILTEFTADEIRIMDMFGMLASRHVLIDPAWDAMAESPEAIELLRDALYVVIGMKPDDQYIRQGVELLSERAMAGNKIAFHSMVALWDITNAGGDKGSAPKGH